MKYPLLTLTDLQTVWAVDGGIEESDCQERVKKPTGYLARQSN
jgi:hypothetical protein